jgi:hypothetical protein
VGRDDLTGLQPAGGSTGDAGWSLGRTRTANLQSPAEATTSDVTKQQAATVWAPDQALVDGFAGEAEAAV